MKSTVKKASDLPHFSPVATKKPYTLENALEVIQLGNESVEIFGMLKANLEKSGTRLDDFDLILATCALTHNLTLVTNNEKHFKKIEGLRIANWAKGPSWLFIYPRTLRLGLPLTSVPQDVIHRPFSIPVFPDHRPVAGSLPLRAVASTKRKPEGGTDSILNSRIRFSAHETRACIRHTRIWLDHDETFAKCSILIKIKEGEDFNHRNILNISRIKI